MRLGIFFLLVWVGFMGNALLAEENSEFDLAKSAYSEKAQTNEHKKECNYMSECRCCRYQTCCAMLPLPVNRNGMVFAEGQYLYWKTYGLFPYSTQATNVTPFASVFSFWDTDLKQVEMSADSGYRVMLGFYLAQCWSVRGVFRQYKSDGSDNFTSTGTGATSVPFGEQPILIWSSIASLQSSFVAQSWQTSSKQKYQEKVLDFDLARTFECNRFTFNPFFGARFAWVRSDSRIDMENVVSSGSTSIQNHTDINNQFNLGGGLHLGVDTYMDLPWGFGYYGNLQAAALIGQFKYRIKTEVLPALAASPTLMANTTQIQKITDIQTNWSLGTGLNWGHHFTNCGYYLGFKVGYEVNIWPNFISVFNVLKQTALVRSGPGLIWQRSILTHGLILSGRFDF